MQGKSYIVERQIAEGGFGFVYQVADSALRSQKYALKQMSV